jgi:hypothetical protein
MVQRCLLDKIDFAAGNSDFVPKEYYGMAPARQIHNLNQSRIEEVLMEWKLISSAPFDRDLELAVIDNGGIVPLVSPCRRTLGGWIDAETKEKIDVDPSHWREWDRRAG